MALTVAQSAVGGTGNGNLTFPNTTGTVMVSGNMPAFSAYRSGTQAITATVWTKVALQVEEFDTNSNYDTSLYRFTPTVAGYYQVTGTVEPQTAQSYQYASIYKNGIDTKRNSSSAGNGTAVNVSALIYLNGSTDFIELYVNFGSSINLNGSSVVTFFQAAMVRAA